MLWLLVQEKKMMEKLWGDNFFDPATKKWTKKATGTATCKRGFVQFVYDPIKTVIEACMNDNRAKLYSLIEKLGVTLKSDQKELSGKSLMKATLQNWIPAHEVRIQSKVTQSSLLRHHGEYHDNIAVKETILRGEAQI